MEISNAYNKALELEGLLLLLKADDVDRLKTELILSRLIEKIQELGDEVNDLSQHFFDEAEAELAAASVEVADRVEVTDRIEVAVVTESAEKSIDEEAAADEAVKAENEDEEYFDESEAFAKEPTPAVEESMDEVLTEAEQMATVAHETAQPDVEQPEIEQPEETPEQEAIADNALFEEEADADIDSNVEPQPADNTPQLDYEEECMEEADRQESEPQSVPQPIHNSAPQPASRLEQQPAQQAYINITIDETGIDVNQSAFAQKARGDIRKVFTLNDIFRFRRQLFGNSQERYTKALTDISRMKSTYEAENYIYNTLGLDKENIDVKDFMKIISAYFMGK
ncbi:MAG: hypothetical protein HDS69_04270 [Bacteroidales bacterium]|nr:hypothetical protein [Bacteroidales bacterium]